MTKPCAACKEAIDQAATKCPRCQAYQHWYRNPRMLNFLWLIVFVPLFWNSSRRSTAFNFEDYKDQFSVSVVEEKAQANGRAQLLTVRLENRMNKSWSRPRLQVESLDASDKLLCVEHVEEYHLVVGPNSSALDTVTLRLAPAETIAKRRVTLTHLDPNRF